MSITETALVPRQQKVETVRNLLERMKPQLALALPKHLTPDRMVRVTLTSVLMTPALLDCTQHSLAGAVLQCSQLGLEPGGILGHAYLVPFRNNKRGTIEVQLIPGYKGLLSLARRSGSIETIQARIVHARDKYKIRYGLNPILEHEPYQGPDEPGDIVAAYAIATMRGGGYQFEWLWRKEIDDVKNRYSRAAGEGPWVTNYEEMAKKTALRRLCKLLPASVELQTAVTLDELAEHAIPQDLGALADASAFASRDGQKPETERPQEEKPPSALDRLADSMGKTEKAKEPPVEIAGVQAEDEASPPALPLDLRPEQPEGEPDIPKRPRGRPRKQPESQSDGEGFASALEAIEEAGTDEDLSSLVSSFYALSGLRSRLVPSARRQLDQAIAAKREALSEPER